MKAVKGNEIRSLPATRVPASDGNTLLVFELAEVLGDQRQVLLKCLFQLAFHQLPHGVAFEEGGAFEVLCQFIAELVQLFFRGDLIAAHDIEQFHQSEPGAGNPEGHHGPFFGLVLFNGILVEMLGAEADEFLVLLEELREVEVLSALIGLLVEVDSPDAVLEILDIGGDVHHKIVGAHIPEQAHEAAFIELHEFLGQPDLVGTGLIEVFLDENISGDAGNMFLHQGILMGKIGDAVGRKQVLQLKAVDTGGVGDLDIVVVVVIVELVHDADPERVGVAEAAVVDPGHIQMLGESEIPFGFEDGVHLYQSFADELEFPHIVENGFPVGIAPMLVQQGNGVGEMKQVSVRYGELHFPAMLFEIRAKAILHRKHGLLAGRLVGLGKRQVVIVDHRHVTQLNY